jgi:D-alanine-D-alanine ligase
VGADAYARIVCQDKFLSKVLARRFNIKSPESILVDDEVNEPLLKELRLPLIIKPNLEGSSIGIDASSKVASYSEANRLIQRLRLQFRQPILVEEFVAGKEICICLVGSPNNVSLFRAMEVYDFHESDFLINNVYSGWEKHKSERIYKHRDVTNELSLDEQVSIKALFRSLGKMDFMRIDGRLNNNGFTLIELTPDAYIGKSSAIADAALLSNLPYKQLLWNIIQTALENYHIPYSNYKEN